MIIAVLKEPTEENRVSLLPEQVAQLINKKHEVWIESGAGSGCYASDEEYQSVGARIRLASEILREANILLRIHCLEIPFSLQIPENQILIGVFHPLSNLPVMEKLATTGLTVISLDCLPRTTRAQGMDVLSSQANIAGYKAVLVAASQYGRYFPMLMTAAGTITPAKVLILGAGVAGLQAIATARRLGGVVEVFDTRISVKEEVLSLGARFIEVEGASDSSTAGGYAVEQSEVFKKAQKERITASIKKADIVITSAQVPGKKAPILVTREMLNLMKPGSVIVDLASSTGGNTEETRNNAVHQYHGITIIGDSNLPSTVAGDASKLYGKNILNFLSLILDQEGKVHIDLNDEIIRSACIAHQGKIVQEKVLSLFSQSALLNQ